MYWFLYDGDLRHKRVNRPVLQTNINPYHVPLVFTHLSHDGDFPIKQVH